MTNSTSPKTYILLTVIATLAIAAVASQVAAAPPRQDVRCNVFLSEVESTNYLASSSALEQAFGEPDALEATWLADTFPPNGEVVYLFDQPVLIDSSDIRVTGSNTEWTVIELGDAVGNWWQILASTMPSGLFTGLGAVDGQTITKVRISTNQYATMHLDAISIELGLCSSGPAPATPMPQAPLPCITGTTGISATIQPTMTPYGRTTTPVPTSTAGGPTPTPTALYTATVVPVSGTASYDSGLITFDNDVSQLSAVGVVNDGPNQFLQWSSAVGNDGRPGVAMMHAGMGDVLTVTVQEMTLGSVVAVFKTGGYVGPVAVSLYARNAYTLTTGNQHSFRVWYLDPDYYGPGDGLWITTQSVPSNLGLSNVWRKFGAVVQPVGGSGKISAIAFSDERLNVDLGDDLSPCPSGRGCIYIDDLRLAYGDAAGLVLPYCEGTGPGTLGRPRNGKTCIVNMTAIDLQAACVAPTTLDFGSWLSYSWCRLWRFLGFFDENRAQVDAIIARQSLNEPFGSIFETGAVYDDLNAKVEQLRTANKNQAQTPIDWVRMFMDGSALDWDRLAQFAVPDISSAATYMANCPREVIDINSSIATGACMSLYLMRLTIIVTFLQWGLNALFVVGILMMTRGDLEKLAS